MTDIALLIVDMQNAFCSKQGSFWKRGRKILNLKKILDINKKLLSFARTEGWFISFTKLVFKEDYSDGGLLVKRNPQLIKFAAYKENSWDSEIIDDLKPTEKELVIVKKRHDPFIGTELEKILRNKQIKKLIICGVVTNICVESTMRSAFDRDFDIILVKDATSASSNKLYKASLETLSKSFGDVLSFDELIKKFKK